MGKHSNHSIEATRLAGQASPVKSLTPTKYHPLMAPDREASSDDDDDDAVVSMPPAVTTNEANLVPFLQLSPEVAQETDAPHDADLKVSQLDDQHNNNSADDGVEIFEGIESMSQQQNLSTTCPITCTKTCVENNNHVEEAKNPVQETMTKSTEKLEGE